MLRNSYLTSIAVLLLSIFWCAQSSGQDRQLGPGWHEIEPRHITLAESRERREKQESSAAAAAANLRAFSMDAEAPIYHPELEQLARGLKYDPLEILNFIYNNIEYEIYYGYIKGPLQTFLEESGNDLDLAVLAINLLNISKNIDPSSQLGEMRIVEGVVSLTPEKLSSWLGSEASPSVIENILYSRFIPFERTAGQYCIERFWIELEFQGKTYEFDPAAKNYTINQGAPLTNLIAFDLVHAEEIAGGLETNNSIKNIDTPLLVGYMNRLAAEFIESANSTHKYSDVDRLLGRAKIRPEIFNKIQLPTAGSYTQNQIFPITNIPEDLKGALKLETGNYLFETDLASIDARQITVAYKTSGREAGDDENIVEMAVNSGIAQAVHSFEFGNAEGIGGLWVEAVIEPSDGVFKLISALETQDYGNRFIFPVGPYGEVSIPYAIFTHSSTGHHQSSLNLRLVDNNGDPHYLYEWSTVVSLNVRLISMDSYIMVDGVQIGTFVQGDGIGDTIRITVSPPAGYGFSVLTENPIIKNGIYAIVSTFGGNGNGKRLSHSIRRLTRIQAAQGKENSGLSVGAYLDIIGQQYFRSDRQFSRIFENILGDKRDHFYQFGIVAHETDEYYIDIAFQARKTVAENVERLLRGNNLAHADLFTSSAAEHQVLEQLQRGKPAISTSKIFQVASNFGESIHLVSEENFEIISADLVGYDLSSIKNIIDSGESVILPRSADINLDSWTGYGYFRIGESAFGAIIRGGTNGGNSVTAEPLDTGLIRKEMQLSENGYLNINRTLSLEPVDLETGAYYFRNNDINIGLAPEPMGLSLTRYYDSRNAYKNGSLGHGWSHNWESTVETFSDENAALGLRRPEDAATQIVAAYAISEIEKLENQTAKHWLMKALIANWAVDSITGNARSVRIGGDHLVFIKQPDESYSAPPGVTASLHDIEGGYELRHRNGMVQRYSDLDGVARLTEWDDIHGNRLTVDYADENVSSVTDEFGRSLAFSYEDGLLTSVADATGRAVSYEHNDDGDLVAYTTLTDPPPGEERYRYRFTYNDDHQILTWISPENETIARNEYSPLGQVVRQWSMGDDERNWEFLYAGNRTIERDPSAAEKTYVFDRQGLLLSSSDALGNTTTTKYNSHNLAVETTDPRGFTTEFGYDNQLNLVKRRAQVTKEENDEPAKFVEADWAYDEKNLLVSAIDENRNETTFTYNDRRQVLTTTDASTNVTENQWNDDGTLGMVVDPAENETIYAEYDAHQNPTRIDYPNGESESFTYSAIGDQLTYTDRRGNTWTNTFDESRNLLTTTDPLGGIVSHTYHYSDQLESTTDQQGNRTTFERNALNNVVSTTDALGRQTLIGYNLSDQRITETSPLRNVQTTFRDQAGRVFGAQNPLGLESSLELDAGGNPIAATNPLDETVSSVFDGLGRLIETKNPRLEIVSYGYDEVGNRTSLTNARDAVFESRFDALNREFERETPEGRLTQTFYNSRGLVERIVEPSGDTTTFVYDEMGWLAERSDAVGTITYERDENGNVITVTENGQSIHYVYDELNRIVEYEDEDGNVIGYEYDSASNLIGKTYPGEGNRKVVYGYDALNRLKTISDWAGNVTEYFYDEDGRLTEIHLPNGTKSLRKYDAASRLTEIIETDVDGFLIYREVNGYDAAGKIVETATIPLQPTNWGILAQSNIYNLDNELTEFGGVPVSSDSDGNMTSAPIVEGNGFSNLTFDARNRLRAVDGYSFDYGVGGERHSITTNGTTTSLIVDPNTPLSQVLIRQDAVGAQTYYIYGLGLAYELSEANEIRTYHYDSRGSTMAIAGPDGISVEARFQYSPYGGIISQGGESDTLFKFNGRFGVQADDSGIYYMRARFYSASLRRFINPDPVGFAGGLNWFAYANGNPVSLVDPFGLAPSFGDRFDEWATNLIVGNDWLDEARFTVDVMAGLASNLSMGASDYILGDYEPYGAAYGLAQNLIIPSPQGLLKGGIKNAAERTVPQGTRVFRVWGDEAAAGGRSWTTVDPRTVSNYRNAAGLPNTNSGRFMSEGILENVSGVRLKSADPAHGNSGGLPEVVVPNTNEQIRLRNVQGLNPEF